MLYAYFSSFTDTYRFFILFLSQVKIQTAKELRESSLFRPKNIFSYPLRKIQPAPGGTRRKDSNAAKALRPPLRR